MKPLRKKIYKTRLKRLFEEWGMTKEQLDILLASICIISAPLMIRIFFALFGF